MIENTYNTCEQCGREVELEDEVYNVVVTELEQVVHDEYIYIDKNKTICYKCMKKLKAKSDADAGR